MKRCITFLLLTVLIQGCRFVDVNWNYLRLGVLKDKTEITEDNQNYYIESYTFGLYFKWAPDVDWGAVYQSLFEK